MLLPQLQNRFPLAKPAPNIDQSHVVLFGDSRRGHTPPQIREGCYLRLVEETYPARCWRKRQTLVAGSFPWRAAENFSIIDVVRLKDHIFAVAISRIISFEELDSITNELHAVDLQVRELLEKQQELIQKKNILTNRIKQHLEASNAGKSSEWDSSPAAWNKDYKALGILKRQFPNTTPVGLTATATSHVLKDAQKILQREAEGEA
uniref:ATP-dependent DNA helicase Q-like 4B n=1 Tax=Callorhinus ursinus TaxID=34884 RepID=A0A3Q7PP30_CALUR